MLNKGFMGLFLVIIFSILIVLFSCSYSYADEVPSWFPNICFNVSYDSFDQIESLFSGTNRLCLQNLSTNGVSGFDNVTNLRNTRILGSLNAPKINLSELKLEIDGDLKAWSVEKEYQDILYIIDSHYGIIACNPIKWYLSYYCYSLNNEPIRYSLVIYDENHQECFSVSEKLKAELYNIISVTPISLSGDSFNKGHIKIKKTQNTDIGYNDLTATFSIRRKGTSDNISLYQSRNISEFYDNCYYFINPLNGSSLVNSFSTNENGEINLIGLPIGTYIIKQTSSIYPDEILKEYEVTIGNYGYIWKDNSVSLTLDIIPTNINENINSDEPKEDNKNKQNVINKDTTQEEITEIIEEESQVITIYEKKKDRLDKIYYSNEKGQKTERVKVDSKLNSLMKMIKGITFSDFPIVFKTKIPIFIMVVILIVVIMFNGKKSSK